MVNLAFLGLLPHPEDQYRHSIILAPGRAGDITCGVSCQASDLLRRSRDGRSGFELCWKNHAGAGLACPVGHHIVGLTNGTCSGGWDALGTGAASSVNEEGLCPIVSWEPGKICAASAAGS